jgi:hypothetical protein
MAAYIDSDRVVTTTWTPRLAQLIDGPMPSNPAGGGQPWLLRSHTPYSAAGSLTIFSEPPSQVMGLFDQGQALLWRISLLTDPVPDNHPDEAFLDLAAPDLRHGTRRTSPLTRTSAICWIGTGWSRTWRWRP